MMLMKLIHQPNYPYYDHHLLSLLPPLSLIPSYPPLISLISFLNLYTLYFRHFPKLFISFPHIKPFLVPDYSLDVVAKPEDDPTICTERPDDVK